MEIIILIVLIIFLVIRYNKKQKESDDKSKQIQAININTAILVFIALISLFMGIYNFNQKDSLFKTRSENEEYDSMGVACCVVGIVVGVSAIFYYSRAKMKFDLNNRNYTVNTNNNSTNKLEELKKLVDKKIITKEEFEKKKKELLKKM